MFFESYRERLHAFLETYRDIWQFEIIQNYPLSNSLFDGDFIHSLLTLNEEERYHFSLHAIDSHKYKSPKYIQQLENLIKEFDSHLCSPYVPTNETTLPIHALQNIKEKKRHEQINLYRFLIGKRKIPSDDLVIDYCGGAGYFARNLAYYFQTRCVSIDIDQQLQERGLEKSKKYKPHDAVQFETRHLNIQAPEKELPVGSPSVAIHSCGNLLDDAIKCSLERNAPWICAIGCCYHKTNDCTYASSQYARENPFTYSNESLVLASRGRDRSLEAFSYSQSVKKYRYLLHILLKKYLGHGFLSVGECKKQLYAKTFQEYAHDRLTHLFGEAFARSKKDLIEKVANDREEKKAVEVMLSQNLIRSKFARLLEISIAIDRALHLTENGYTVELVQLFDSLLSPRNIAIWAESKA